MPRKLTVPFRGEQRQIEYTVHSDYSVNAHECEWWFVGVSVEDHKKLNITDEEEQEIADLCWHDDYMTDGDAF